MGIKHMQFCPSCRTPLYLEDNDALFTIKEKGIKKYGESSKGKNIEGANCIGLCPECGVMLYYNRLERFIFELITYREKEVK